MTWASQNENHQLERKFNRTKWKKNSNTFGSILWNARFRILSWRFL